MTLATATREITDPAIADLREIVSYIARDNADAATVIGNNAQIVMRRLMLEVTENSLDCRAVSKVEQIEAELRQLSQAELRQIREWLDDVIEDELEFAPEFEKSIQQAEREMAEGRSARVRAPEGS